MHFTETRDRCHQAGVCYRNGATQARIPFPVPSQEERYQRQKKIENLTKEIDLMPRSREKTEKELKLYKERYKDLGASYEMIKSQFQKLQEQLCKSVKKEDRLVCVEDSLPYRHLKKRNQELEKQLGTARQILLTRNERNKENGEISQQRFEEVQKALDISKEECRELAGQKRKRDAESENYRKKLEETQKLQKQQESEIEALTKKLEQLEKKCSDSEQKTSRKRESNKRLKTEVEDLKKEKEEISSSSSQVNGELEDRLSILREELVKERTQYQDYKKQKERDLQKWEEQKSALELNINVSAVTVYQIEQEKSQIEQENLALKEKLEALRKILGSGMEVFQQSN